ncbi:squalene/phytoene synthase family protein [Nocardia sp. NPDC052112]|uniref:phytoene/squalene synthase family protein n=1 Tax=Nocardia sp. NPDC052112 TaxID=3155646 RepID=UPI0034448ADF
MNRTDRRILGAARITDPGLRQAYARCRRLHARHGRSYYLAILLLPPWKRPYAHALYGFARFADEIVDTESATSRAAHFAGWSRQVLDAPTDGNGSADDVTMALRDTMRRWDIPIEHVTAFLGSMWADRTVSAYETIEDFNRYMYGSAAVIGLQMVPFLGPLHDEAYPRVRALGEAFQLRSWEAGR